MESPLVKTPSETRKKASDKYRENNKEKVNEQRKEYYNKKKGEDPDFLEKKREKAREYYKKRKEKQQQQSEIKEVVDNVEEEDIEIEVKTPIHIMEEPEVKPVEQEIIIDEEKKSVTLILKKPTIRKSKKQNLEK
jgi:hypothetical protein